MMSGLWKLARYYLLIGALIAPMVSCHYTRLSRVTVALSLFAVLVTLASPGWFDWWIRKLESPAERREAVRNASQGFSDILFLRPFAVDGYWHELQDFIVGIVRSHNSQYAASKSVFAIGREDHQGIAKLQVSDDSWLSQVHELARRVEAIVVLPIQMGDGASSGILEEIVSVLDAYAEKTILVMPSRDDWDRHLKGTPFEGQLERLWTGTIQHLQERAPSLKLRPYDPAGCFWIGNDRGAVYRYNHDAAEVLFKVLDEERVRRSAYLMKHDPHGWAELQRMRQPGYKRDPFRDTLLR